MKTTTGSITALMAAAVVLSGCGPASNGPATSASKTQPSSSSAETTQTSTVAPSSVAVSASPRTLPTPSKPKQPATGTALAAVARLTVKGRAPKTGYTRAQFGQAWYDTDHNGCDTRNDILRRDLKSKQMKNACKVMAGALAPDPYTCTSIRFVYGGTSEVDIDHLVALSDAWQKGAATWASGKRLALANDPLNLLAVDSSTNRSKGDGDAATWLPPNKSFRCTYVARQVAVKGKYGVWVASAERDAMARVLTTCPTGCGEGQVRGLGCLCRAGCHGPCSHDLPDDGSPGAGFGINAGGSAAECPHLHLSPHLPPYLHPPPLRRLLGLSTTPTAPRFVQLVRLLSIVVTRATPASSTVMGYLYSAAL
jgi:hypothetical protein